MEQDRILQHFRDTDALLDGHFILSSGLHSASYLQCARALQFPYDASNYGHAIAAAAVKGVEDAGGRPDTIKTVASPAIGGLVIGYEVAKALNLRFLWTERKEGVMSLRRGFRITKDEEILVVEDVITTGGSVRECVDVLHKNGARVVAVASIVDRSGGEADIGVPRVSLVELDVPSYSPDECPMCKRGMESVKPGSR
ncbi:MAG: orotate phosphoribosyltransferase [Acidobacteriota bacterium]|nr:orotate phosphoribosyltransferase [Acidobacteriota bacterium]MDH3530015.1 orotate phosphoribosyltransferase [Acidobacteriota bacterium]